MKMLKGISLGVAAAALCVTSVAPAQAQEAMTTTTVTTTTTMAPMAVTGTVLRYYVDRAGFVSAMDVQTTDGIRMVRFSPSMAQMLSSMYPVGSTINGFVTSYTYGGMPALYLAGVGTTMPVPGAVMMPSMVSDLDVLKSVPYTMIGAKRERFSGDITGVISDDKTGDVLALVVDNTTLVRVPMENRLKAPMNTTDGITPLYRNSKIDGYGFMEAPRYGVVSPYSKRIIATGITVDGRALGALGFGKVMEGGYGLGVKNATPTAEESGAMRMGYTTYVVPVPAPVVAPVAQ